MMIFRSSKLCLEDFESFHFILEFVGREIEMRFGRSNNWETTPTDPFREVHPEDRIR